MRIKKMTACFGGLEQAALAPGAGLTVITAPNEGGKSTWVGFLKAMLYGIDTRERDKVGFLADKNRYQPWSGAPMSGELELEWEGRDITLRRFSNRSGPFQGFEAVYTASGDPAPGLTAANAGQTLLGVSRDVFVRSALVGQNGTVVTAAPELERRVAALATSGEEDVSFSATQRVLKDWRNRRKVNRATGLIPELENELAQVEQALRDMELARAERDRARGELERLARERDELTAEAEIHRRLAQKELNARYVQALQALDNAKAQLTALPPPDPAFAGLTAQQARDQAKARMDAQAEELHRVRQVRADRRDALERQRAGARRTMACLLALLGLAGILLLTLGLVLPLYPLCAAGALSLLAAAVSGALLGRKTAEAGRALAQLDATPAPAAPDAALSDAADAYAAWLVQRELLEREVRHCQERADDLYAQGGRQYTTLELLHPPARSAAETEARLREVELDVTRWQTRLDQAIGALRSDPLELEARREALLTQLEARVQEFDALELALDGLNAANDLLRERFSPALNREAAAIFSALTGGRYQGLSLSRDFSAQAEDSSSLLPRSALYLSAGTVDQLYLAVRLALCRLTVPAAPLLLDDALAAFDDRRAELALDYLRDLSRERQILLFTCHSREARWAGQHQVPVVQF